METSTIRKITNPIRTAAAWLGPALLSLLAACAGTPDEERPAEPAPQVSYLEDGSTLKVEDPYFGDDDSQGLTLLEKIRRISDELNVLHEKNALLAQELESQRRAGETLQQSLETARQESIRLNEEIAGLKVALSERVTDLDQAHIENRDLMEKLINLKIEKAKVEKELLKVKIAALSGEG